MFSISSAACSHVFAQATCPSASMYLAASRSHLGCGLATVSASIESCRFGRSHAVQQIAAADAVEPYHGGMPGENLRVAARPGPQLYVVVSGQHDVRANDVFGVPCVALRLQFCELRCCSLALSWIHFGSTPVLKAVISLFRGMMRHSQLAKLKSESFLGNTCMVRDWWEAVLSTKLSGRRCIKELPYDLEVETLHPCEHVSLRDQYEHR
jgi:hypothetical protein